MIEPMPAPQEVHASHNHVNAGPMNRLRERLTEISKQIVTLRNILGPVLRSEGPRDQAVAEDREAQSPVVQEVEELATFAEGLTSEIDNLTDRIQLPGFGPDVKKCDPKPRDLHRFGPSRHNVIDPWQEFGATLTERQKQVAIRLCQTATIVKDPDLASGPGFDDLP